AMMFRQRELDASDGVTTDAEGRFRLTDLTDGQAIDLFADAAGYVLAQAPRIVVPVEDEIELRLRRGGWLTGRVVDEAGEAVPARLPVRAGDTTPHTRRGG